jgi:hypothetical protein
MKGKEKYLKLVSIVLVTILFLTTFLSFKKIVQLEKEITSLQKEKQEITKQYQNCNKRFNEFINECSQKFQQTVEKYRKNLTPREVVEKFLQADASGARMGGKIAKEAPSLKSYLGSGFFSAGEDFVMVIKKYEILEDYPSKDNEYHFVKVRYYCEEGVGSGSMGIPTEKEIPEGGFYIVPCSDFFKWLCPNCFKKSSLRV